MSAQAPIDIRMMNSLASLLFVVAFAAFAVVGLRWVVRLPAFAIQGIEVDGDTAHLQLPEMRHRAVTRLEGNVFTLDLAQAQRAFETLPWVRRAMVRRVWPDRIAVTLEEHRAAAYWAEDGRDDALVNVQGEVFRAGLGANDEEDLPELEGPAGSATQVLGMQRRLDAIFEHLAVHVESLTLTGRGSWRAELDTGARVELGSGSEDEILARATAFVQTVPQLVSRYQAPLEYADLRHRDGYAVRLKGVVTHAEGAPNRQP